VAFIWSAPIETIPNNDIVNGLSSERHNKRIDFRSNQEQMRPNEHANFLIMVSLQANYYYNSPLCYQLWDEFC
jgi:hypothetical protein